MSFSPLPHGELGVIDEIILLVEALLVVALLVTFLRARARRKTRPPGDQQPPSESP